MEWSTGRPARFHVEPLVMDVLIVLASRPGEVVERGELVDLVWQGRAMSDEPLNRCISQLRRVSTIPAADLKLSKLFPGEAIDWLRRSGHWQTVRCLRNQVGSG